MLALPSSQLLAGVVDEGPLGAMAAVVVLRQWKGSPASHRAINDCYPVLITYVSRMTVMGVPMQYHQISLE